MSSKYQDNLGTMRGLLAGGLVALIGLGVATKRASDTDRVLKYFSEQLNKKTWAKAQGIFNPQSWKSRLERQGIEPSLSNKQMEDK